MPGSKKNNGKCPGDCPSDCLIAQAVSGLSVGLMLINSTGKLTWMNRTAERILGRPCPECLGRPVTELFKDPQMAAFWNDAMETDQNYLADISVHWPEPMELKLHATHCVDDEGRALGRALLLCDLTQEKRIQVELSQAVANRLLDLTSAHMPPEPVANLTQQELRVLRLVGRGLANEEIARKANISPSTVRSHLKSLYRKLGLDSRAAAVSFAVRHHLV